MRCWLRFSFVVFAWFNFQIANAQEQQQPYSRWDFQPAVGYNFSNRTLETGEISDYLIDYDFNNFYWQPVSATFYLFNFLGFEITLQESNSDKSGNSDKFDQALEQHYGDRYYISYSPNYYSNNAILGDISTGYYGLVFRYQINKFQWKAKMQIGSMSLENGTETVTLKEKGSNNQVEVSYSSSTQEPTSTIIAPSLYAAYRVYKLFLVHVNFNFTYTNINFTYQEKITDLVTNERQFRTIPYSETLRKLAIGAGITIEVGTIKPKKSQAAP